MTVTLSGAGSFEGWFENYRQIASPNFDARPDAAAVELLVIHCISLPPGEYGGTGVEDLFCNQLDCNAHPYYERVEGLKVSAHFLIRRDGECIQFVSTEQRAWHAGLSCWQGRQRCNDFSVGIELEGLDDQPFALQQYDRLIELTGRLQQVYPRLSPDRICGHSDIAPGRKSDPGAGFDWQHYLSGLEGSG